MISQRHPGARNWVDPVGHRQGVVFLRWQGLVGEVERQPTAQLVAFASLRDALPADTPMFGTEARRRHVRRRVGAA